jgi:ATP-binding cassette subfamily B protein
MSAPQIPTVKRRDIINFAKHYWSEKRLMGVLAIVFMGVSVGVDVLYPVFSGRLVDKLTELDPKVDGTLHQVFIAFGGLLAIQFAHTWCWTIALWFWTKFAVHNMYRIVTDALHKVQRFSTDWHVNAFAGATVRKITRGMWSFDTFEDTIFMGFYPASIIAIGMTIMLIIQVPVVGWFALPMVVFFVAASIYLAVKITMPRFKQSAATDTAVGATIADIMTAIPTVKSFAGESREDAHFAKVAGEWKRLSLRAWLTATLIDFARSHIRIMLMIGMVSLTILMWYRGQATPGDVTLAITSFFIIGGYLRDIGRQTTELLKSVSEMEDVVSFWIREDDIQNAPDAKTLAITHEHGKGATITFDTVDFTYKQGDRKIYDGLTVEIKAGEKVALVGASGSGKSTFVKLVQRLYDIQSGAILIDGQDIAKVTQESLRRNIALVPQEPVLFHRGLAENIAYGRPDATLDDIRQAAHEAYAAEFIERLPLGYNTLVGERGIKLSGGERQRVAIARALLADCPILILDEATSSLDSVSEHYIQMALDKLMEGRTTITIAHRLATIQKADRILVFADGRIIEQGTHTTLLQNPDSTYRRLYEMQALDLVGE